MKIQGPNNWVNQNNYMNKSKTTDDSFGHLLKEHTESAVSNENNVVQPRFVSNIERIDFPKKLMFSNVDSTKFAGFRELTNDAFSDMGTQILREIESLCDDETGEGIDVKVLQELLELYENAK